jgi:DNA-binding MarR family transcriptional regulator
VPFGLAKRLRQRGLVERLLGHRGGQLRRRRLVERTEAGR